MQFDRFSPLYFAVGAYRDLNIVIALTLFLANLKTKNRILHDNNAASVIERVIALTNELLFSLCDKKKLISFSLDSFGFRI